MFGGVFFVASSQGQLEHGWKMAPGGWWELDQHAGASINCEKIAGAYGRVQGDERERMKSDIAR